MPQDIVTLDQMINFCVTNPMEGDPLEWNSAEMTAIAAYVMRNAKEGGKSKNACAVNPSKDNPCSENPCTANPCGANPCTANPCTANPCTANPCSMNPCSVK